MEPVRSEETSGGLLSNPLLPAGSAMRSDPVAQGFTRSALGKPSRTESAQPLWECFTLQMGKTSFLTRSLSLVLLPLTTLQEHPCECSPGCWWPSLLPGHADGWCSPPWLLRPPRPCFAELLSSPSSPACVTQRGCSCQAKPNSG